MSDDKKDMMIKMMIEDRAWMVEREALMGTMIEACVDVLKSAIPIRTMMTAWGDKSQEFMRFRDALREAEAVCKTTNAKMQGLNEQMARMDKF